jgi:small basic protein (TIGR04137 family)
MTMHRSFGKGNSIKAKRNVLKRFERIDVLKSKNKWKEGDSVFGLQKTKSS